MTDDELTMYLNYNYGTDAWPKTFTVDHETYAYCCQAVFDNTKITDLANITGQENILWRTIALGPHKGLMFKNIELVLP